MAIYHFSGKVVSRSSGKSAIASAAYRAGEKLYDERQDRVSDYSRKQDVVFNEIMLPEGAPEWMKDREKLWNAAEMAENRKDSQLAREFNFALPRELSSTQNIALVREFVQSEFVSKGMIADLCIHDGKARDGEEQPHAHVMLTMRQVTEGGFGLKERGWNGKENLKQWREAWADYANKHLEMNGIDQKIDHRTLEEQGIGLEAQKKIGPDILRIYDARIDEHQRIAKENGDKILEDPSIALNAITYHKSTFTNQDLARFVNRHTIDAEQFQMVYEKVKASEQIVSLDREGIERFTTKEMLALESKMLDDAVLLKDRSNIVPRSLDISTTRHDDEGIGGSGVVLAPQQKEALEHIVGDGDIKCLVGYAGTGKSRLLAQAREVWEANGYSVHGATLSGIAAEGLEAASGIESRTLASRCYYWDRGAEHLTKKDVLVIDEAGMLGSRQVARVLEEVKAGGAKVVLIGDPQQLQAIEAGAAFRAVSERTGFLELTEIRRQQEPWQQEATKEFALQHTEKALSLYEQHNRVHLFETQAMARKSLVEMWNEDRTTYPYKTHIMLAYTRRDAQELNDMARSIRKENQEFVGDDQKMQTSGGEKTFAIGDRIYFLQNDRGLGVKNGTLGTIEEIKGEHVTVSLDREGKGSSRMFSSSNTVTIDLEQYNHITHGYAATIHKAQGVTVEQSYVLASKHLDSHAIYVGMSRHRESADLFWSKEEFANKRDLERVLGRDRSKDITGDYLDLGSKEREVRDERGYDKALEIGERGSRVEVVNEVGGGEEKEKEKKQIGVEHEHGGARTEKEAEKATYEKDVANLDDFKAFQERFEREHPEYAEAIHEEITSSKVLQERREQIVGSEGRGRDMFLEDAVGGKKLDRDTIELETFREKFERERPKDAAIAREEIMPPMSPQEKRAEVLIDKYQRYEERYHEFQERGVSRFNEREAKDQMERCAREICNDKSTMDFLQKKDKDLFKEMEQMREHEKTLEMQKGFELSL